MKQIISLGAGVQSSTMALMAAKGEITPMPDCAIFADTQDEPKEVYEWLDWLEKQLPFPVVRVSRGRLSDGFLRVRTSKKGTHYTKHGIPAFIPGESGKPTPMPRQCTFDYKIQPIHKEIRNQLGEKWRSLKCVQWIGISIDELDRMAPSRKKYIESIWPLIDKRMSRQDCIKWMERNGYPKPPRSACVYCPYHNSHEWLRLKLEDKKSFDFAVEVEKRNQEAIKQVEAIKSTPYLTPHMKPLDQVDFTGGMADLFDNQFRNDCTGMCGV